MGFELAGPFIVCSNFEHHHMQQSIFSKKKGLCLEICKLSHVCVSVQAQAQSRISFSGFPALANTCKRSVCEFVDHGLFGQLFNLKELTCKINLEFSPCLITPHILLLGNVRHHRDHLKPGCAMCVCEQRMHACVFKKNTNC